MKQFLVKNKWSILVIFLLLLVIGYLYIKLSALPVKLIKCEPTPHNNNCWISARFMDLSDCKNAVDSLDNYYTYTCARYVSSEI